MIWSRNSLMTCGTCRACFTIIAIFACITCRSSHVRRRSCRSRDVGRRSCRTSCAKSCGACGSSVRDANIAFLSSRTRRPCNVRRSSGVAFLSRRTCHVRRSSGAACGSRDVRRRSCASCRSCDIRRRSCGASNSDAICSRGSCASCCAGQRRGSRHTLISCGSCGARAAIAAILTVSSRPRNRRRSSCVSFLPRCSRHIRRGSCRTRHVGRRSCASSRSRHV